MCLLVRVLLHTIHRFPLVLNRVILSVLCGWCVPLCLRSILHSLQHLVRSFFICCLLPMWMSLILFSPDATARRSDICFSFLGSTGTSPAPFSARALLLSCTRSVMATLSLCALILAIPAAVLSTIVLVCSQHSWFRGFVILPCDASAAQPGQPTV